jgi:hypothetical protein
MAPLPGRPSRSRLSGFDEFKLPATPNPDAATQQSLNSLHVTRSHQGPPSGIDAARRRVAPTNLATIVIDTAYTKLIYRIKDVIRKGGTVRARRPRHFRGHLAAERAERHLCPVERLQGRDQDR